MDITSGSNPITACSTPPNTPKPKKIGDLPPELLLLIFSAMPIDRIVKAGQVCRSWQQVYKDSLLWQRVEHRYLNREADFHRINILALKCICERQNSEDDLLIIQLLARSEAVKSLRLPQAHRPVDRLMSGLAAVLLNFDLSQLPSLSFASAIRPLRKAAKNEDNILARFVLALGVLLRSREPMKDVADTGFIYALAVLSIMGIEGETEGRLWPAHREFKPLKALSAQGHLGAKIHLLNLLESDADIIEKDAAWAASLQRELVEGGNPFCQVRLAKSLLKQDRRGEAVALLEKAAQSGNPNALFLLGTLYNEEAASSFSSMLAGRGEEEVHFFIGCRYQSKSNLDALAQKELNQYRLLLSGENMHVSVELCEQLACMYQSGHILAQDLSKASEYRAIAQSILAPQTNL